jgi:hypothetical protein
MLLSSSVVTGEGTGAKRRSHWYVFPLAISMILLAAAAERPPAAAAAGDPLQQQQQRRQRQHHHAADDATADSGSSWGSRGVAGSSDDVDVQRARHFRALRDRLHLMTEAEAEASIASFPRPQRGTRYRQHKIDHFVVLFMENRAADHMFGCMLGDTPGFDGIPSSGHSIPYDPAKPSEGGVQVQCGAAENVCTGGAGFNRYASHFAPSANNDTFPYGVQGDQFSFAHMLDVPAPEHLGDHNGANKKKSRCSHYHCLNNSSE